MLFVLLFKNVATRECRPALAFWERAGFINGVLYLFLLLSPLRDDGTYYPTLYCFCMHGEKLSVHCLLHLQPAWPWD